MAGNNEIGDGEIALAAILNLIIGSECITDPKKAQGYQDALAEMRDNFQAKGNVKATAIVEYVRRMTNVNELIEKERRNPGG